MPRPDYALHRRRMRRLRISEALSFEIDEEQRHQSRDMLLQSLAQTLHPGDVERAFERFSETAIDETVSIALAAVTESNEDRLAVALMCSQLLADDGQFARLRQLSARFVAIADRLEVERPILASDVRALSFVVRGQPRQATRVLRNALGLTGKSLPEPIPRSRDSYSDVLAAGALFAWLERWMDDGDSGPQTSVEDVFELTRKVATDSGDGLLFANIEFLANYAASAERADIAKVLAQGEEWPASDKLRQYIARKGVRTLFPSQVRAIRAGALQDGNRLVALPTSSGKTFLAELRIALEAANRPGSRAIYIAPYRLLARQVERDLTSGLRDMGLNVQDLGGSFDASLESAGSLDGEGRGFPDVAIATPERLDALVRLADADRPGSHEAALLLDSLSLLVFDEAQLVGRSGRGSRFEMILARTRHRYPEIRILGLAAATYGVDELATWLGAPEPITSGRRPTGTLEILWQTDGRLVQRSGRTRSGVAELPRTKDITGDAARLALLITGEQRPVLIVEPTRPICEGMAKRLQRIAPTDGQEWRNALTAPERTEVDQVVEEVHALLGDGHPLGSLLADGIAYHHAGVPAHLLRLIEDLARAQLVRFFVATTTVAEGADLPFRSVIIPHLNFQGESGRLDRDLYLNIIGRAGRASFAVEGMVFILQSEAKTLRDLVTSSLWSSQAAAQIRSVIPRISASPTTLEGYSIFRDLQGQLLSWVASGTPSTYLDADGVAHAVRTVEDQLAAMAQGCLAAVTGRSHINAVQSIFTEALRELEQAGLVTAASPYQATALGQRSRLTGLSHISVLRLIRATSGTSGQWLWDVAGAEVLSVEAAELLARLALETEETLAETIWMRRAGSSPEQKLEFLRANVSTGNPLPDDDANLEADASMLAGWIRGESYEELADLAPSFARGTFSSKDQFARSSDAADQMGRIAYSAAWSLAAVRHLSAAGEALPIWLRDAVEMGVPSLTACSLVRNVGLARTTATRLSRDLPPNWEMADEMIRAMAEADLRAYALTSLELARFRDYCETTS